MLGTITAYAYILRIVMLVMYDDQEGKVFNGAIISNPVWSSWKRKLIMTTTPFCQTRIAMPQVFNPVLESPLK